MNTQTLKNLKQKHFWSKYYFQYGMSAQVLRIRVLGFLLVCFVFVIFFFKILLLCVSVKVYVGALGGQLEFQAIVSCLVW